MPGPVIDPDQNPGEEKRFGIMYVENESFMSDGFAVYDKIASGTHADSRYFPNGYIVNVAPIDPPDPENPTVNWHGIIINQWVKIIGVPGNQGSVVKRLFKLMTRYKNSMFNGVTHPGLPNHSPDTGGHGANINAVLS